MSNVNRNRNISSLLFSGGTGHSDNNMNCTAPIKMSEVAFTSNPFKFKEKPPYQMVNNFSKRALSNKGNDTRLTLHTQEGRQRKFK